MNNPGNRIICITGGHITPALAVMDEIRDRYPGWRMIGIGRRYSIEQSPEVSVEQRLMTGKGAEFLPITAGRWVRSGGIMRLISFLKIPVGLAQASVYLARYKPDIVVSFGGYIALPVSLAAYILGIPVITHEQTRTAGLANRIIGVIAKRICITFDDTIGLFPKGKTTVTGLPVRKELFMPPEIPPFDLAAGPVVYITGGSTGAVSMNDILFPWIPQLTDRYVVIHQTGRQSLAEAQKLREGLPADKKNRYYVADFIDAGALAWIYKHAKAIIGRSGANTVMEAAIFGKPMLCVPLPWSAGREQLHNAQWLKRRGLGTVFEQDVLTYESLESGLVRVTKTESGHAEAVAKLPIPQDGASRMLSEINAILGA